MNPPALVEEVQRGGKIEAYLEALVDRQAFFGVPAVFEGRRHIGSGVDFPLPMAVVGQFHDVVEVGFLLVDADVQDVEEPGVASGNRLVFLNAKKLPLEQTMVLRLALEHNFDCPVLPRHASGKPDIAIAPFPDVLKQLVVGNAEFGEQIVVLGLHHIPCLLIHPWFPRE